MGPSQSKNTDNVSSPSPNRNQDNNLSQQQNQQLRRGAGPGSIPNQSNPPSPNNHDWENFQLQTKSRLNAHQTADSRIIQDSRIRPQPICQPFYKGQCDDQGRHHGQGVMKYSDASVFKGIFVKGSPHKGIFQYPNGNIYEGFLKDNQPHGKGIWRQKTKGNTFEGDFVQGEFIKGEVYYNDGSYYKGTMKKGCLKHGEDCFYRFKDGDNFTGTFDEDYFAYGRYLSKNGDLQYNGEFNQSLKHGKGHLHIKNVADYKGTFKDDEFSGQGTLINLKSPQKQMYQGTFLQGKKHGRGKLFAYKKKQNPQQSRISNQNNSSSEINNEDKILVYDGQFRNNEKHGKGIFYHQNKRYQGQFNQGKFEGQGVLYYSETDTYKGHFKDNKKHGKGQLFLGASRNQNHNHNSSHCQGHTHTVENYIGDFENDQFHGHGKIRYSNGDTFEGQFKNNKRHGKGQYISKINDMQYQGSWQNDVKQGQFIEIYYKGGNLGYLEGGHSYQNERSQANYKVQIRGNYTKDQKNGKFEVHQGDKVYEQTWVMGIRKKRQQK